MTAVGRQGRRRWLAGLCVTVAAALMLIGTGVARAGSFTVQTCNQKTAAPWQNPFNTSYFTSQGFTTNGFSGLEDDCSQPAGEMNFYDNPQASGTVDSAGLTIPSGEQLTGISMDFNTTTPATGTAAMEMYVNSESASIFEQYVGSTPSTFAASVPNASSLTLITYCNSSANCTSSVPVISIGELDLTLTDTGSPAITASGGTLTGTVSGVQSQLYSASDSGSGVDKVTLSLGGTVVATNQSTCNFSELAPCPSSSNGTFEVDTTQIPNGTYPVILTAYDASGDPTPTQVGTVTVHNAGTLKLKAVVGTLKASLAMNWTWSNLTSAVLKSLTVAKLPRGGAVTITCTGDGCPYKSRRATAKTLKSLTGRSFAVGDVLTVTTSAPGYRSKRVRLRVRSAQLPAVL